MVAITKKQSLVNNFSHFVVDFYISQRGVLLAFFALHLGLSNTWLGVMTMLGLLAGGITQPFFGWLTDRVGVRWVLSTGVVWIVGFMTLAVATSSSAAPWWIIVANLGAGAFHPSGTHLASEAGRTGGKGKEATNSSFFFLFGNLGFILGPLAGGALIDRAGVQGLLWISVIAIPLALGIAWWFLLRQSNTNNKDSTENEQNGPEIPAKTYWGLAAIWFGLITAQGWAQQNIFSFVPKYLGDIGQPAVVYGSFVSILMAGSALGLITGGIISDRFGKRLVVILGMLASIPFILGLNLFHFSWIWYPLVFLIGFFTGMPFSVMILESQKTLRVGRVLAAGIAMGWTFLAGALGSTISGWLADLVGIPFVFGLSALLAFIGGLLGFLIARPK